MREPSKRLKKELRQHVGRAWEAEMKAALGDLAAKFDGWRAGHVSTADLDAAIHKYHDGAAREIWRRFSTNDLKMPLAHAVAVGLIEEQSLSPEVRDHISSMVAFFREQEQGA
jgi:hypothetical protein